MFWLIVTLYHNGALVVYNEKVYTIKAEVEADFENISTGGDKRDSGVIQVAIHQFEMDGSRIIREK